MLHLFLKYRLTQLISQKRFSNLEIAIHMLYYTSSYCSFEHDICMSTLTCIYCNIEFDPAFSRSCIFHPCKLGSALTSFDLFRSFVFCQPLATNLNSSTPSLRLQCYFSFRIKYSFSFMQFLFLL